MTSTFLKHISNYGKEYVYMWKNVVCFCVFMPQPLINFESYLIKYFDDVLDSISVFLMLFIKVFIIFTKCFFQ